MCKRVINLNNKYESKIFLIDDEKIIYKIMCLCPDFSGIAKKGKYYPGTRIKKVGIGYLTKYKLSPCKHLRPYIERLIIMGYKLKVPKVEEGSIKLTKELKEYLLKRANYECEECPEKVMLEIHRKTPKTHGGLYSKSNCKVLCHECHKQRNAYQFSKF